MLHRDLSPGNVLLSSRGPVLIDFGTVQNALRSADTISSTSAGFQAHSHCGCGSRPVYSTDDPHSGRARELQQLWNESTRGRSGDDAVRAFRQAYEGR